MGITGTEMLRTPPAPATGEDEAARRSRALVEGLRAPGAYAHRVDDVQVMETHISYVLLAGDFAYKIRKPVRLPFLDFTTLDARRRDCEEELRLNARFAPALYEAVVPITGTIDAPCVDGSGAALEYAVRMRRFDPALLLDRIAAAGTLEGTDVDRLAAAVARLHATARPAPATTPFGTSALVLAQALDNFSALERFGGEEVHALVATLREWTRREHAALAAVIEARRLAGFVRDAHGDLHLGNVVMRHGEPVPFDCIEFDPCLRVIDVMSDAAFTYMDLLRHRLPRLAARFLDRYLEASGDHAGLRMLRFYAVYRAMVRAKVASLGAAPERARAPVLDYLRLAAELCAPAPAMLVLMHGLSGSGKTTVSSALVEALPGIRLRSDVERKRRHGLDALARSGSTLGSGLYAPGETAGTYARLAELAGEVLDAGFTAIVDATFLKRAQRELLQAVATARHLPCAIVACEAPEAELRRRLALRAAALADASEADAQVLALQLAGQEPLAPQERAIAVVVASDRPQDLREACDALLRRL